MSPHSSEAFSTPRSDRAWSRHSSFPRSIALFMHSEEVHSQMRDVDAEMAAAMLAEFYHLEDEFEQFYGMSMRVVEDGLNRLHLFAMDHPERMEGEEVMLALPARLFYRLGYAEGLRNATQPGHPSIQSFDTTPDWLEAEAERQGEVGVRDRVQEVLFPAYMTGLEYGRAERYLMDHADWARLAVDGAARRLLASNVTGEDLVDSFEDRVMESLADYGGYVVEPNNPFADSGEWSLERAIRVYVTGRKHQVLSMRARQSVLEQSYGNLLPFQRSERHIASVSRSKSSALEALSDREDLDARKTWLHYELKESIALLAAYDITPHQMAAILRDLGPLDSIGRSQFGMLPPDNEGAAVYREVSRPIGTLWLPSASLGSYVLEPAVGDEAVAPLRSVSVADPERIERWIRRIRRIAATEIIEDPVEEEFAASVEHFRSLTRHVDAPGLASAAADLAALRAARTLDFELDTAQIPELILDYEARLRDSNPKRSPSPAGFSWSQFRVSLLRNITESLSERLIAERQSRGDEYRSRAERQLAFTDNLSRLEQVAHWSEFYRREALELLEDGDRSESALLFARANVLEGTILDIFHGRMHAELARSIRGVWQEVPEDGDTLSPLVSAVVGEHARMRADVDILLTRVAPRAASLARNQVDRVAFEFIVTESELIREVQSLCVGLDSEIDAWDMDDDDWDWDRSSPAKPSL